MRDFISDDMPEKGMGGRMQDALTAMQDFSYSTFLNAVSHKMKTDEEIEEVSRYVAESVVKMQEEYGRMDRNRYWFLNTIVTNDNRCYETCHVLANRLRVSIGRSKKIFQKFHVRAKAGEKKKRELHGLEEKTVFSSSYLTLPATGDLFGGEYPKCVDDLYKNMSLFNEELIKIYRLIRDVLNQEAEIRDDHEMCYGMLMEYLKQCKSFFSVFIEGMEVDEDCVLCPNDILKMREENPKDEVFASAIYHNVSPKSVKLWWLKESYRRRSKLNITAEEQYFWGEDVDKILKVRTVLGSFDNAIPEDETIRENKLPSKYVVMFMEWCGVLNTKDEKQFVEFFNKKYKEKGKYEIVSPKTVNNQKNKMLGFEDEKEYKIFARKLERIVQNIESA